MQPQEQSIYTEITFDAEDIEAFRRGILTDRQSEKILRRKQQIRQVERGCLNPLFFLLGAPFALIFAAILLYTILSTGSRAYLIITILIVFGLIGALLVLFQLSRMQRTQKNLDIDLRNGRVATIAGRAAIIYEDDSSRTLYLTIKNIRMYAGWLGNFRLDNNESYRAYYLPESKILLAVENSIN